MGNVEFLNVFDSETYGGRNTPEKIIAHSYDLRAAADQNFDAEKPALKKYGATDEQLEEASAKLHQINESVGLYKNDSKRRSITEKHR